MNERAAAFERYWRGLQLELDRYIDMKFADRYVGLRLFKKAGNAERNG